MRLVKIMQIITLSIFFIFLIWFAYQIYLKLTGHSPTVETILASAIVMIIAYLLSVSLKMGEFIGETKAFMRTAKASFRQISDDMNSLKSRLDSVKRR